jgi:AcrR family transcriptional regulator
MDKESGTRRRGRPPRETAAANEAILDAVYALLHEKSVRDLTIEEVARRAGVGKPTIYKWWPSKAALVLDMFDERVIGNLAVPGAATAEEAIRGQVTELIRRLNGFPGKVAAEIIAEGQSEPAVLQAYRDRYLSRRRTLTTGWIERARASGEFRKDIDPDVLIDMIYGPIYYRLLVRHRELDERFGEELVGHILSYVKS